MEHTWTLDEKAAPEDLAQLAREVFEHGRALANDGNAQPISCLVRDGAQLVAGGSGRTEYGRLFINYLWVKENLRGKGVARRILKELEAEASKRGCSDALIETLDDSVARLYAALGFEPVAVVPCYVGRFNRHIMIKSRIQSAP